MWVSTFLCLHFNPRSREGSDPVRLRLGEEEAISIHFAIECQIGVLGGDKQRVKQLFHSSIAPFR